MRWLQLSLFVGWINARVLLVQQPETVSDQFSAEEKVSKAGLRMVGSISMLKPAFVTSIPNHPNIGFNDANQDVSEDLLVSTFGVAFPGRTNPDGVSRIENISDHLRHGTLSNASFVRIGSNNIIWPNEISLIDDKVVVAGGFLVPGKHGHISSIPIASLYNAPRTSLWTHQIDVKKGFFHRVKKINLRNKTADQGENSSDDGTRWVSCQGWKEVFGGQGGQMVFFSNASSIETSETSTNSFNMNPMTSECDCFFDTLDLNNDGVPEFIVPLFFGRRLSLIWTEHPLGDYTQTEFIRHRIIDDTLGAAFDIQIVDLDNDGRMDFLVTNHQDGKKGMPPSILAYTYNPPSDSNSGNISDWMNAITFERHVIASGFKVVVPGIGSAAPGSSRAVSIRTDSKSYDVLVTSGDGSEECYLSVPKEKRDGEKFVEFETTVFHKCHGTVGGIFSKDLDGDGWTDVVVPCYDENKLYFFSFKP